MSWDAEELCAYMSKKPRGFNLDYEDALLERFPPVSGTESVLANDIPILLRPGIIVDSSGRILAWALPGILTEERQVRPYNVL